MSRLQVVEYFETVINQIDLITETRMIKDCQSEKWLNERRDKQIRQIKQMEQSILVRLERLKEKPESLKKVFDDEFCFVFDFGQVPFVIKVNRYVTPTEIQKFKKSFDSSLLYSKTFVGQQNFNFFEYSVYLYKECELFRDLLTTEHTSIDMSLWFNNIKHELFKKDDVCTEYFFKSINDIRSKLGRIVRMNVCADGLVQLDLFRKFSRLRQLEIYGENLSEELLDPIRNQLEFLTIDYAIDSTMSWRIFRGMFNLKELKILHQSAKQLDLDENGELFADLIHLKKLQLDLSPIMFTSGWRCRLPQLEYLDCGLISSVSFPKQDRDFNVVFDLPALEYFKGHLFMICYFDRPVSQFFKYFGHSKHLIFHIDESDCRRYLERLPPILSIFGIESNFLLSFFDRNSNIDLTLYYQRTQLDGDSRHLAKEPSKWSLQQIQLWDRRNYKEDQEHFSSFIFIESENKYVFVTGCRISEKVLKRSVLN